MCLSISLIPNNDSLNLCTPVTSCVLLYAFNFQSAFLLFYQNPLFSIFFCRWNQFSKESLLVNEQVVRRNHHCQSGKEQGQGLPNSQPWGSTARSRPSGTLRRGQGQASSSWGTRMASPYPHSIVSWAEFSAHGKGNIRRHQILWETVTFSPEQGSMSLPVASHTCAPLLASFLSSKPQFLIIILLLQSFMVLEIKSRTWDMLGNHSIPPNHSL